MTKRSSLFWSIFVILFLLTACQSLGGRPDNEAHMPLTDCHLSGRVQAKCGTLAVPENRDQAGGRMLDLNIAVIPATSSFPEPDPLFLLAGGPGQAATEAFAPFISRLEDINEDRDLVLVDQRGTGESSPLKCDRLEDEQEPDLSLSDEEAVKLIQACAQEMAETADLTQYTTDAWAADLDAVREALGYEKINLYGQSYGTRAAQAYARLFPDRVRTITLDAVTGPELVLFLQMPKDGQRALELLFERCANDPVCHGKFPDFQNETMTILDRLEQNPEEMVLTHPLSGEEIDYTLTRDRLSNFVYTILYSTDLVSLLPLLIHQAYLEGDYGPLVSEGIIIGSSSGLNSGLLYAVACSEDAPLIDTAEAEALQSETSFAPRADLFLEICQAFPRAEVAQDFRQPLTSDWPVLLLSGDADPVTPPQYASQVAENLPNSKQIIVPNFGHGLLGVGCTVDIFNQFISAGSVDNLDVSCLNGLQPPPFFIDFSGPEA